MDNFSSNSPTAPLADDSGSGVFGNSNLANSSGNVNSSGDGLGQANSSSDGTALITPSTGQLDPLANPFYLPSDGFPNNGNDFLNPTPSKSDLQASESEEVAEMSNTLSQLQDVTGQDSLGNNNFFQASDPLQATVGTVPVGTPSINPNTPLGGGTSDAFATPSSVPSALYAPTAPSVSVPVGASQAPSAPSLSAGASVSQVNIPHNISDTTNNSTEKNIPDNQLTQEEVLTKAFEMAKSNPEIASALQAYQEAIAKATADANQAYYQILEDQATKALSDLKASLLQDYQD